MDGSATCVRAQVEHRMASTCVQPATRVTSTAVEAKTKGQDRLQDMLVWPFCCLSEGAARKFAASEESKGTWEETSSPLSCHSFADICNSMGYWCDHKRRLN
eukprot:1160198-Pelagomonas_calceolata.AAC.12